MKRFSEAIDIISKYQGFNEKAYPDFASGGHPYSIGFGTQFYPDGTPVAAGQMCTKQKALQYLKHELQCIDHDLDTVNLHLDESMRAALLSFVHSIGWDSFLYSEIIDAIGNEDWPRLALEMSRWIFDQDYKVIGNLIDRRREEIRLFLSEIDENPWSSTEVLLTAFRRYTAAPHQVRAIRTLEEKINPYILAEFANSFDITEEDSHIVFWDDLNIPNPHIEIVEDGEWS